MEDGSIVKPANGYHIKDSATPITKGKKVDKNDDVTPEKALELMKDGYEIRVRGYDDDYKNFTGVSIADYDGWEDSEIIETLAEYPQLQSWNEKYEVGGAIPDSLFLPPQFEKGGLTENKRTDFTAIYEILETATSNGISPSKLDFKTFSEQIFDKSKISYSKLDLKIAYDGMKNRKLQKGGQTDYDDFNLEKFLKYVHPKVAAIFKENGITLSPTYKITKGDKTYEGIVLFSKIDNIAQRVVIGYWNDNDITSDSIGEIEFGLQEKEFHVRFPNFKINDVQMYAKGGWTNDHNQLNKGEDYEVRYNAKNPRKLAEGGEIENIGRLAKGKTLQQIADIHNVTLAYIEKQMNRGAKVEMEHTTDENIARTIAKDHLFENPDYYIMLSKMENKIEVPKKLAKGGPVWELWPQKKVKGVYLVEGNGVSEIVVIDGFEKYNNESYQLTQPSYEEERIGPKDIYSFKVLATALNKINKGEKFSGTSKDGLKYRLQRIGNLGDKRSNFEHLKSTPSKAKKGAELPTKKIRKPKDPNRKGNPVFELARKIRKPGQNWQEAIQDAKKQLREEKNKS